ncbi:MAG: outer membrane lipoprotein-sorting protein [Candidatus Neomarinimicrobiota bacterium]
MIFRVLSLLCLAPGFLLRGQNPTGADIIEKVNEIMSPMNSKGVMTQTIVTTSGKKRTFVFEMYSTNRGEKTLMRYTKPASIKDQAFLMLNNADDIWSYFPRTNRIRKLASHAKKQKLQGSDFTYEDMGSGDSWIHEFKATNLGSVELNGDSCWKVRLDGIDEQDPAYEKMMIWVRQYDHYPLQVDYYEDGDVPTKSLFMKDIQQIDGIPTAMHMTMHNHGDATQTEMITLSITYGWEPPPGFFSERNLRR